MHHLLCKSLLVISIILVIVAMATPDWQLITVGKDTVVTMNYGLFQKCGTSKVSGTTGCSSVGDDFNHDRQTATRQCQGLAIAAAVSLVLSLVCDFIPIKEFKHCRLLGGAFYALGLVLLITCIVWYATKAKISSELAQIPFIGATVNYGYSFYLAIAAVVLAAASGMCKVISHKGKH